MREEIKQAILEANETFWDEVKDLVIAECSDEDVELYNEQLEIAIDKIIKIVTNK